MPIDISFLNKRRVRPVNQWRRSRGQETLEDLRKGARTPTDNPVTNSFPKPRPSLRPHSRSLEDRWSLNFPKTEDAKAAWNTWKADLLPELPGRYDRRWYSPFLEFFTCRTRRNTISYLHSLQGDHTIQQDVIGRVECCGEVPLPRVLNRFVKRYFEGGFERYYRPLPIRVSVVPSQPAGRVVDEPDRVAEHERPRARTKST